MCQQGEEFLGEVIEQGGDLRLVWFLKNLLRTGLWECIILGELHLWEGKALHGECLFCFWLLIFPRFPSASCMTASSFTSVFEESCFGFWSIASSRCPCLRESIFAWSSDLFLLLSSFCHLFKFSLASLFFTVFVSILVRLWCVDNALIKVEIEEWEYSILLVMSELSTVRCDRTLGL